MTHGVQDVQVYAIGIVAASVCVPTGMTSAKVEQYVNALHPTGISSPWQISKDEVFKNGMTNPCVCDTDPSRMHYLMEC